MMREVREGKGAAAREIKKQKHSERGVLPYREAVAVEGEFGEGRRPEAAAEGGAGPRGGLVVLGPGRPQAEPVPAQGQGLELEGGPEDGRVEGRQFVPLEVHRGEGPRDLLAPRQHQKASTLKKNQ